MKIAYLEDNEEMASLVKENLEQHNCTVDLFNCELDFNQNVFNQFYDLIILDNNVNNKKVGLDLCSLIKSKDLTTKILMMSGDRDAQLAINAIASGADGFISKPFSFYEFYNKVALISSDFSKGGLDQQYNKDQLELNFFYKIVKYSGIDIELSKTEFKIFECLIKNKNRFLTRDELVKSVSSSLYSVTLRNIDVHMSNIRKKIDCNLKTKHGFGYGYFESDFKS